MKEFLIKAQASKQVIATLDGKTKNRILNQMAEALLQKSAFIVEENNKDMAEGRKNNLESSLLDRLLSVSYTHLTLPTKRIV